MSSESDSGVQGSLHVLANVSDDDGQTFLYLISMPQILKMHDLFKVGRVHHVAWQFLTFAQCPNKMVHFAHLGGYGPIRFAH